MDINQPKSLDEKRLGGEVIDGEVGKKPLRGRGREKGRRAEEIMREKIDIVKELVKKGYKNTVRLCITITAEQYEYIFNRSQQMGLSISDIIKLLIIEDWRISNILRDKYVEAYIKAIQDKKVGGNTDNGNNEVKDNKGEDSNSSNNSNGKDGVADDKYRDLELSKKLDEYLTREIKNERFRIVEDRMIYGIEKHNSNSLKGAIKNGILSDEEASEIMGKEVKYSRKGHLNKEDNDE